MNLLEYRRYDVLPGKMQLVRRYFEEVNRPDFQRHGFSLLGPWEAILGTTNTLHYLLQWDDASERARGWAAFHGDPDHQRRRAKYFAAGEPMLRTHVQLWKPLSPPDDSS